MAYSQVYIEKLQNIDTLIRYSRLPSDYRYFVSRITERFSLIYNSPLEQTQIAVDCYILASYLKDCSVSTIITEAIELHKAKNAGYSGLNDDPWENFKACNRIFGISVLDGILARATDKYMRFINLISNSELDRVNEPLVDTVLDLAAYILIYQCIQEEHDYAN